MKLILNPQDYKIISPDLTVDSYLNQDEDAVISGSTVGIKK